MKKKTLKSWALGLLLVLLFSSVSHGIQVGEIDYIQPVDAAPAFGGNLWHDNYVRGTAVFPLVKAWELERVGLSDGQPIIVDDLVFVLASGNILVMEKTTGKLLGSHSIQYSFPFSEGSVFVFKHSNTKYQILAPSMEGEVFSILASVSRGGSGETTGVSFQKQWGWKLSSLEHGQAKTSRIVTRDITLLKDKNLNKVYAAFGTYTGHLVVLDMETGSPVVNGVVELEGVMGAGSGIVYKDFSNIISPVGEGMALGTVMNGVLQVGESMEIHQEAMQGPTAYAVIENPILNVPTGMLLTQDKHGTIIAYNSTNGSILFKLYHEGARTVNSFAISDQYILATLASVDGVRGETLIVDYREAIIEGQNNEDFRGNDAIVNRQTLAGENFTGVLALKVAEQNEDDFGNIQEVVRREVFLTSDRSGKIKMTYLEGFNPVPYGFRTIAANGSQTTSGELQVSAGIISPLTYAGGYLIFGDGEGTLHAYTASKENNLALMNLENSEEKLTRGETYVAAVDVINYTGEAQQQIPIEFWINGSVVHSSRIDIPENGLTVKFQYTLPKEYEVDAVELQARLNMREPRTLAETTYEDNVLTTNLEVYEPLVDLEARDIQSGNPVPANTKQTASVKIRNNSEIDQENVLVWYRVNGKNVKTERIDLLRVNEEKLRSFQWSAPNFDTNVTLSVVVDPNRETSDIDRSNNTATRAVKVNKGSSTNEGGCNNNTATGTFSMYYVWLDEIITHREVERWTDSDGNVHRETYYWDEEIWKSETVSYTEKMQMSVSVNTNQQNENSRGGWEIIPYALKNGLQANKVTRSGYGIEVKVNINYSTTPGWESLPSPKATSYGPNYLEKLKNVRVYANLPNGQRVEMVRTSGGGNGNSAVYELPEISYTPAGLTDTWRGRFFSMPPRTPDGRYPFTIDVVGGGQNGLSCTLREEIYIYGDVYRDTNIQRNIQRGN